MHSSWLCAFAVVASCGGAPPPTAAPVAVAPPSSRADRLRALVDRCERSDDPDPCYAAGAVVLHDATTPAETERADKLVTRGHELAWKHCRAGDAPACRLLAAKGNLALQTAKGDKIAISRFVLEVSTRGCHAGDLELCLEAAAIQVHGNAGTPDLAAARALTQLACDRDSQEGCVELGVMLVEEDAARATRLFETACQRGRADGCGSLATMRMRDAPAGAEQAKAARAAAKHACEMADAAGCALYGHALHDGIGGDCDLAAARDAFDRACKGGDDRGCQMVRAMHDRP